MLGLMTAYKCNFTRVTNESSKLIVWFVPFVTVAMSVYSVIDKGHPFKINHFELVIINKAHIHISRQ